MVRRVCSFHRVQRSIESSSPVHVLSGEGNPKYLVKGRHKINVVYIFSV